MQSPRYVLAGHIDALGRGWQRRFGGIRCGYARWQWPGKPAENHETAPNLPVIIISAQNTIVTAIRANEAKAFDYLPKPFDLPELMHRAAKALERRHPPQVTPL